MRNFACFSITKLKSILFAARKLLFVLPVLLFVVKRTRLSRRLGCHGLDTHFSFGLALNLPQRAASDYVVPKRSQNPYLELLLLNVSVLISVAGSSLPVYSSLWFRDQIILSMYWYKIILAYAVVYSAITILYLLCDRAKSFLVLYGTANKSGESISTGPFSSLSFSRMLNSSYGDVVIQSWVKLFCKDQRP